MGLTACPDCGNEVSTEAAACPRCGAPTAKTVEAAGRAKREEQGKLRGAQVITVIFLGFCAWGTITFYRACTGADLVGTQCTLHVGTELNEQTKVPLYPTSDEANNGYGAALMGRFSEKNAARATWLPSGTRVTIEATGSLTYRVATTAGSLWVATGLCRR